MNEISGIYDEDEPLLYRRPKRIKKGAFQYSGILVEIYKIWNNDESSH